MTSNPSPYAYLFSLSSPSHDGTMQKEEYPLVLPMPRVSPQPSSPFLLFLLFSFPCPFLILLVTTPECTSSWFFRLPIQNRLNQSFSSQGFLKSNLVFYSLPSFTPLPEFSGPRFSFFLWFAPHMSVQFGSSFPPVLSLYLLVAALLPISETFCHLSLLSRPSYHPPFSFCFQGTF